MNSPTVWQSSGTVAHSNYFGAIEIQGNDEDFHFFELYGISSRPGRIVFGGVCNTGFNESGYMVIEDGEAIGAALNEVVEQLQAYYKDGKQYAPRLVCNDRM